MDHSKDFRSTVLQAPSRHERNGSGGGGSEDDQHNPQRDRRHLHDISSIVAPPAPPSLHPAPAHHHSTSSHQSHNRHSSFNLRSPPPQTDFQHPHAAYTSPQSRQSDLRSPPRPHQPGLSHPTHPYGGPSPSSSSSTTGAAGVGGPLAPTLPALGALPSASSSGGGHHSRSHSGHQHHQTPQSPLHPPSGAYYPPPETQSREKPLAAGSSSATGATSSYYDPLTDTTRERKLSDAGSRYGTSSQQPSPGMKSRDPYAHPQHRSPPGDHHHQSSSQHHYYANGRHTSPGGASYPPRSPVSHHKSPGMTSPGSRRATSPNMPHASANGTGSASRNDTSPLKAPAAAPAATSTPSRSADPMSFSNILSSAEPAPKPREQTPPRIEKPTPEPERDHRKLSDKKSDHADKDSDKKAEVEPAPKSRRNKEPSVKKEPEPDRERAKAMATDQETEPEPEPEAEAEAEAEAEMDVDDEEKPAPKAKRRKQPTKKQEQEETPAPREKKRGGARKSKSKSLAADLRDSEVTPSQSRRASSARETPTPRVPAKRQANGDPKHKALPADKEKKVQEYISKLDAKSENLSEDALDVELAAFRQYGNKRRRMMNDLETDRNDRRRYITTEKLTHRLVNHMSFGKRRFDDIHYDDALQQVRERELFAEKERKKDMQRKRRREKSMAITMEAKNNALKKAENAEDEDEKQRYLREAEKASKKAQQTKLILQKGIKGPARNIELNLEGGTMATFHASDMEPGSSKKKSRGGARPKKSKEQKQAEKDSAEAAQAAIDAGQELPPPKDESKIRIKIKKSKKPKDTEDEKEKPAKTKGKSKKEKKEGKDKAHDTDHDVDMAEKINNLSDVEATEADKENKEVTTTKSKSKKEKEPKVKEPKVEVPPDPDAKFYTKGFIQIYDQIWRDLARKDVSKTYKLATESYQTKSSNLKKTAILASKEAKRWQLRTNKGTKDQQARAKRVMRDMMGFWKRNEREERDLRKAAEKQELENARREEAERETARQKRKLNFLISQTELYSHFIGKKIKTSEVERSTDNPEIAPENKGETEKNEQLNVKEPSSVGAKVTGFEDLDFDDEDESKLQEAAMANAQNAIAEAQRKAREFNEPEAGLDMDEEGEMNFQNPAGMGEVEIEQPKLINAQLKEYQLKGLNWLANLYEQGINGILADEMGLGKTVQSISVMAYLAEKYDIWGPFLVVAPASTLHNWEQEIRKFVPQFKILPYWGAAADRKVLRKFWDRKHMTYRKEANFHVCVTSYQLVVSDVAYFQKMKWQYMILDEAQAIKSSSSSRWKSLLGFHCRNRLLLTGTPIQNNMQELWALLHFIMPSLFDSHDEFSEWFSKDIESHAQSNTKLNEDQLKRLHMILKPFMLRRVKKHVQKELGDKIEKDVFCDLTYRQRAYYANLRNQISIMDLIEKATQGDDNDSGTLMNLVMQFRKVCNHPDLFERADTLSPYSFTSFGETGSFVREGNEVTVNYSTRNNIDLSLPRQLWRGDGRLDMPDRANPKAGWRNKALQQMFNIWTPENVRERNKDSEAFSWLRFADATEHDVYKASHDSLFTRATELSQQKQDRLSCLNVAYDEPEDCNWTPAHALFQIKQRNDRKPLADVTNEGILANLMNVSRADFHEQGLGRLEQAARPGASAPPIEVTCSSRGADIERENVLFNVPMRRTLYGPTPVEQEAFIKQELQLERYPLKALHPTPDFEKKKFTNISVPSMSRFVTDSGKLAKLDELLFQLKAGGHRVLLYFQMTRMIDLMEEYLTYRNYKYCRLDGSTKLEDRRDTVADFQTRPEIFVFLLSTRAGGLGINLTSADTVIFYDSDWNPTIDSQAMDRAHRLGQTRQVTVYRLITKGTIEERIRMRALQKEEVQRVVIQGGGGNVDFSGRRQPENRNRDIAMWLADDEQAEMIERREKELAESGELDKQKKKGGKRKRAPGGGGGQGVSLDEMYHEGEGNFDDKLASGAATPAEEPEGGNAKKRRTGGAKKAKTMKQRLAIADGTG